MTVAIPLAGARGAGKFALVDDADYPLVADYSWHLTNTGYVSAYIGGGRAARRFEALHRFLLQPGDSHVDHANANRLDNRRSNLRLASRTENNRNSKQRSHSRWPYKGVRHNGTNWTARIRANKREHYLGAFATAEAAAAAYDEAARRLHGAFARTNGGKP